MSNQIETCDQCRQIRVHCEKLPTGGRRVFVGFGESATRDEPTLIEQCRQRVPPKPEPVKVGVTTPAIE